MHDPVVSMEHALASIPENGMSRSLINPSIFDVRLAKPQRRPPVVRRDATTHTRCDSAVA
jgi:hypothetical protein